MRNRLYLLVIHYFFVMLLMLLLSGFWMFVEHTQLTVDGVMAHYSSKSVFGLLETITPHLFGMGIVVFIVTHFYAVTQGVYTKRRYQLTLLLFVVMIISNASSFFITESDFDLALVKFVSVVAFAGLTIALILHLTLKIRD